MIAADKKKAEEILTNKCKEFNINLDKTFVRFGQAMLEFAESYHEYKQKEDNLKEVKPKIKTMDKIKSITEAFSMQPNTWSVFKGSSFRTDIKPSDIAEIKLERTGPDEFYDYLYRAYNSNGKKLFEWQPKAVNIAYFID